MDVIAIVAQKGGTGKTTLAVSLAVAAERDGRTVAIVDLDPQASASGWGDRRRADSPVVVSAQPARLPHILQAAEAQGADLVLIDTPPRSEQAAMAAAKAGRHVLIPCRPAVYDLETVTTTLELVRFSDGGPATVVLNGVPARGRKKAQATEVLEGLGVAVCPASLGHRAAFDHAGGIGLSAQEYEPRGKAAQEIEHVYQFMCQVVNSSTSKGVNSNG